MFCFGAFLHSLHPQWTPARVSSVRFYVLGDESDLTLDPTEHGLIVFGTREQVTVNIVGHLNRRVANQLLHPLRGEPGIDPHTRRIVTQGVKIEAGLAVLIDQSGRLLRRGLPCMIA